MNIAPMQTHQRRFIKGAILGLVILLAGVVIGVVGTLAVMRHMKMTRHRQPPAALVHRISSRIDRKLNLTVDQTARIEAVLTRRIKNLREIRNETAPLLMAELTLLRDDVAAELDEKQSVQWLRWFDRIEEQLASFMKAGNQAGCTSESQ